MRRWLAPLLLGALLGAASAAGMAAAERESARAEIGRPVQQAEQLLREKRFTEALAKLAEADKVRGKTAYETYVIEATRAAVLNDSGDYRGAIAALEAALATRVLSPGEETSRLRALVSLSYAAKDDAKLIAFAERYYRAGGTDEMPRQLMAEAHFRRQDFAAAADASRTAIEADRRAGRANAEPMLQILAGSEYRLGHRAAYQQALMQLVALDPKRDYWAELIASVAQAPGFAARLALDLDRLRAATGTLAGAAGTMEAAERALAAGLPGEAKRLLEQGFAAGVLGKAAGAAREQRLLALAERQASEDLQALPQRAKEAAAAPGGGLSVRLGEDYAGYGRWEEAIAAFRQGLAKGGLAHEEDAKLRLGVVSLAAGRGESAAALLRSVGGDDGTKALAQLWLLAQQTEAGRR